MRTSHPRETCIHPLLREERSWDRKSALRRLRLAPLLSPSCWPRRSHSPHLSCGCPLARRGRNRIFSPFLSSQWAQPANLLLSPFVINPRQGHFKSIFACFWFFSSQNEERSFTSKGLCSIISLALISLPHSPAYFKSMKSVLTIHCHWSLFSILVPRHSCFFFFFFFFDEGVCQYSNLAHNLFRDDIWPRRFAFWLSCCWYWHHTRFPVSKSPPIPLQPAKGVDWIDKNGNNGHPVSSGHPAFGNRWHFIFMNICKYSLGRFWWRDDENSEQNKGEPGSDIWPWGKRKRMGRDPLSVVP